MRRLSRITSLRVALLAIFIGGCKDAPPPPFTDCDINVARSDATTAKIIDIDLYLDATTSMEGYVGRNTEYGEFLYALDALKSQWHEANVRFFKFGTHVDSVRRDEFLAAREDLRFYRRRGFFERTNIDSVLVRADPDRISVIVTDLFQDDGDTNELVDKIKKGVFKQELAVGILGIESRFKGRVYDAPGGPYTYASIPGDRSTYRPFYALLLGEAPLVRRLYRTLANNPAVSTDHFVIISPDVVEGYTIALEKSQENVQESEGINGFRENWFKIRDGYEGGTLKGTLTYEPLPTAPPINPADIELILYRRGPSQMDTTRVRVSDLRIQNLHANGQTITFDLDVKVDDPEGTYRYLLLFQTGEGDGLNTPTWIRELSSTNPTAKTDPNKTLNLERLVSNLINVSSIFRRPRIACATLTLTKL